VLPHPAKAWTSHASLTHRRWRHRSQHSVVMRPGKSLRLVAGPHHHFQRSVACANSHPVHAALLRPVHAPAAVLASASQVSVRALWRWVWVSARCRIVARGRHRTFGSVTVSRCGHPLRFYIRPYFV